jgi:hypothetical protein
VNFSVSVLPYTPLLATQYLYASNALPDIPEGLIF